MKWSVREAPCVMKWSVREALCFQIIEGVLYIVLEALGVRGCEKMAKHGEVAGTVSCCGLFSAGSRSPVHMQFAC